ncbi:MAG: GGDEF domain-containing protein [Bacilli bacterium]|nr:GGDEF domain-containing protein [Bacilli bacterium]
MKKRLIIFLPLIIAITVFVLVYRYYNKEDKTTTLTIKEKRWVEDNKDTAYDFEVINDYPLYGIDGKGVFFNFIKDFEDNIGIDFNEIPYSKITSPKNKDYRIRILDKDKDLSKDDLKIFDDYYVVIGKTYQRINHIKDMKNLNLGILSSDSKDISYYLKSGSNLSYTTYNSIAEVYAALDKGEVNMIVVPNIMYLNYTIETNKYHINYFLTEMSKQVVLTLSKDNNELNEIVRKYYKKWKLTKYVKEYNKEYLNYYIENNNISAKTLDNLISKNYVYGYAENEPYEAKVNNKMAGIAGEYIDRASRLSGINFKIKKFKTKKDLKEAIDRGEVDIYFDYYNYNNNKYLATISPFIEDYVVLGKEKDNHVVTSFESLRGQKVAMLQEDSLYNYFENNSRTKISTYPNIHDLVKKSDTKLLIVDNEVYSHYQNNKFSKYQLLYKDTMMNDYKFMVKKNNKEFYDLFNYIINTNSYYNYRNSGLNNLHASLLATSTMRDAYIIILILIFAPIILITLIYLFLKYKHKLKKIKITDRHKYTDMLTSLKNRNYLNAKIPEWEDCKVFPQAIVIVDLNNVKYVNDNYGHSAGDDLIVKAAGVLVNTQLENSEIIRTDGNEFLIYLVGYSEKQVATYTKKLSKEMKSLPHEFGAAIGFSMITDDIKTLDDTINEATLEMITNKEEYK